MPSHNSHSVNYHSDTQKDIIRQFYQTGYMQTTVELLWSCCGGRAKERQYCMLSRTGENCDKMTIRPPVLGFADNNFCNDKKAGIPASNGSLIESRWIKNNHSSPVSTRGSYGNTFPTSSTLNIQTQYTAILTSGNMSEVGYG